MPENTDIEALADAIVRYQRWQQSLKEIARKNLKSKRKRKDKSK